MKQLMREAFTAKMEAERRLWKARDEVGRLKARLADADATLRFAQSDYEEHQRQMGEVWPLFRSELEEMMVARIESIITEAPDGQ